MVLMKSYRFQCPNDECYNDKFLPFQNQAHYDSALIKCQNEGCKQTFELRQIKQTNQFGKDVYVQHFLNCSEGLQLCRFCEKAVNRRILKEHEQNCDHKTL